jgi:hypothetical protein
MTPKPIQITTERPTYMRGAIFEQIEIAGEKCNLLYTADNGYLISFNRETLVKDCFDREISIDLATEELKRFLKEAREYAAYLTGIADEVLCKEQKPRKPRKPRNKNL